MKLSAGAAMMILFAVAVTIYVFRAELIHLVLAVAMARLGWHWLRHRLGLPVRRRGWLVEMLAAGMAGLAAGRYAHRFNILK